MVRRPARPASLAFAATALLLLPCLTLPAASAELPERFTVLQAAFYSFSQAGPTHQSADERAVLVEHASELSGPLGANQHNASDALLNATTRSQLVLVEYQLPVGTNPLAPTTGGNHFQDYYKAPMIPTSIFDGTKRLVAFGSNTASTYMQLYTDARAVLPGASIDVDGAIVIQNGFVDANATAVGDLAGTRTYLHVAIVEDHVASATDGRDLRFVVRTHLGGAEFVDGVASGRFNFTLASGWAEGRLGAVVWAQSEGPTEGTPPAGTGPPGGVVAAALYLAAPVVMGAVLVVLIVVLTRREQALRR